MNIALIGNNTILLKKVAHNVALQLDMFFVDALEYIEYDLVEKERALSVCTKEYLIAREVKAIKTICAYENTLISFSEELFVSNKSIIQQSCMLVYLSMDKSSDDTIKATVSNMLQSSREQELFKMCRAVVLQNRKHEIEFSQDIVKTILSARGEKHA